MKEESVRDMVMVHGVLDTWMQNAMKQGDVNSKISAVILGMLCDCIERTVDREGDKDEYDKWMDLHMETLSMKELIEKEKVKKQLEEDPDEALNTLGALYAILRKQEAGR